MRASGIIRGVELGEFDPAQEPEVDVTRLLRSVASGNRADLDALLSAIYDDLHRLAANQMQAERRDHTLQPTALVHEAYMKLIDQRSTEWQDRLHFFAVAARIIRRVLVDHARTRASMKRGGGRDRVPMDRVSSVVDAPDVDLVALDEALEELARLDARQAQVVELRFFAGLTIEEVAQFLSIGHRSVDRDWTCARAWLYSRLAGDDAAPGCVTNV